MECSRPAKISVVCRLISNRFSVKSQTHVDRTGDFLSHWISNLNPEQQQAVLHDFGPLLILAGAGSGKTTVLVSRTGRLIAEGLTTAERICVLTFTNKAATELKHRVARKLGNKAE